MTWSKFDDAAPKNPKAVAAGNDAWALWAAAIMYCNRHLTDGFVSLAALAADCLPVPISTQQARRLAERLCDLRVRPDGLGLFERTDGGLYKVHDFLEWNPSKSEVEAQRKADRERKRKRNGNPPDSGRAPPGIPDGIQTGIRAASGAHAGVRARVARPDPPDPPGSDLPAAADPKDLPGSARAPTREPAAAAPAAAADKPWGMPEVLQVPAALRAQWALDDAYWASLVSPETWPEVQRVGVAFEQATGQQRLLGRYSHDAGVKAIVVLYATGYMPSDLERAVRLAVAEPWWRADGAKRGLASLTPEVVARALQAAPARSARPADDSPPYHHTRLDRP